MEALVFMYRDHDGQLKERRVLPQKIYFGRSPYYPAAQWLMDGYDLDHKQLMVFAMALINRTI